MTFLKAYGTAVCALLAAAVTAALILIGAAGLGARRVTGNSGLCASCGAGCTDTDFGRRDSGNGWATGKRAKGWERMERILYLALISGVADALLPEGRLQNGVRAAVGLMAVRAICQAVAGVLAAL